MNIIISSILQFCLIFSSVQIKPEAPLLVVFCNPGYEWEWKKYNPDILFSASNWDDFDKFLMIIKEKAGDRPIEIDIDCHGEEQGLYLVEPEGVYRASMGFVVNEITSSLNTDHVTLILECCYSGRTYRNTIRGNTMNHSTDKIKDFPSLPTFPIYGIGDELPNAYNFVYLQYRYNVRPYFYDLRKFEVTPLGHKSPSKAPMGETIDERITDIEVGWVYLFSHGN